MFKYLALALLFTYTICQDCKPETKTVEVGPIWSQADFVKRQKEFQKKVPQGFNMTGHWNTTVQGKMSVVQVTKPCPKIPPCETKFNTIEAGPIWSQVDFKNRQAEFKKKTPKGWEMTGHWNTTVPGKMSVFQVMKKCPKEAPPCKPEFKNVEVGPVWSQDDYNKRKAEFEGKIPKGWKLTGQWNTTVPNKMSVVQATKPCSRRLQMKQKKCPKGTTRKNGKCVKRIKIKVKVHKKCPKGTYRKNGKCMKKIRVKVHVKAKKTAKKSKKAPAKKAKVSVKAKGKKAKKSTKKAVKKTGKKVKVALKAKGKKATKKGKKSTKKAAKKTGKKVKVALKAKGKKATKKAVKKGKKAKVALKLKGKKVAKKAAKKAPKVKVTLKKRAKKSVDPVHKKIRVKVHKKAHAKQRTNLLVYVTTRKCNGKKC